MATIFFSHHSLDDDAAVGEDNAVATWHPGGNTLGETLKRNTKVTDVKQHSYSTTSARNLGDISSKDVKKVIGQGERSKVLLKVADGETTYFNYNHGRFCELAAA